MLKTCRQLSDLLTPVERRKTLIVFFILLVVALLETVGVASIMPFIAVLSSPDAVTTNPYLSRVYQAVGFASVELFMFWLGVAVLVLLIASLAAKAVAYWAQVHFATMRNHTIGCRLVSGYLRQPYQWFLNRHSANFATTVLQEVHQVVHQSLFTSLQVVANGLTAVFLLALLVAVDPILAVSSALVMGCAYGLVFGSVRGYLTRIGTLRRNANRKRFKVLNEAFSGIKDVKIGGLESAFDAQFQAPSAEMARHTIASQVLNELPRFAMQALIFGGMMLVILYLMGSRGSFQNALPVMAVYAFAGYRMMPALQAIYHNLAAIRFTQPTLDALHEDVAALQSQPQPDDPARAPVLRRQIELRDVGFTYPDAPRPALAAVSLTVPACQTIGLVGTTGSGKTTCVDVVLGLLPPSAGELWVDDVRITARNVRAWQRGLGYVPQQIYLIDDSITANIAFGVRAKRIDHAAVERAARIANLHDFIVGELPDGYATPVGERGVRLSGGQRQRIGIARALYHDPDVLILDEATSALDNVTERAVMDAVRKLGQRKTIILIAHRLSTVRACDRIFMLEQGNVVASGSYDELLENNAGFRAMSGAAF